MGSCLLSLSILFGQITVGEPTPADPATRPPEVTTASAQSEVDPAESSASEPEHAAAPLSPPARIPSLVPGGSNPSDTPTDGEPDRDAAGSSRWGSTTPRGDRPMNVAPLDPARSAEPADVDSRFAAPGRGTTVVRPEEANDPRSEPEARADESSEGSAEQSPPATPEEQAAVATWRQGMTVPKDRGLDGNPTRLVAAISHVEGRDARLRVVKAYWELASRAALYHFAEDRRSSLARLPAPQEAVDRAVLKSAQATATADVRRARLEAILAQHNLAETGALSTVDGLPLPNDEPLLGAYRTQYEQIFAGRSAPTGITRIHQTLPLRLDWLQSQALAVQAAAGACDAIEGAYTQGSADVHRVVDAHRRLAEHRADFVDAAHRYNADIADYALTVVGPAVDREQIVGMLIKVKPATRSVLVPGRGVRQATNLQPVDRPQRETEWSTTDPIRDEAAPESILNQLPPPTVLPEKDRVRLSPVPAEPEPADPIDEGRVPPEEANPADGSGRSETPDAAMDRATGLVFPPE